MNRSIVCSARAPLFRMFASSFLGFSSPPRRAAPPDERFVLAIRVLNLKYASASSLRLTSLHFTSRLVRSGPVLSGLHWTGQERGGKERSDSFQTRALNCAVLCSSNVLRALQNHATPCNANCAAAAAAESSPHPSARRTVWASGSRPRIPTSSSSAACSRCTSSGSCSSSKVCTRARTLAHIRTHAKTVYVSKAKASARGVGVMLQSCAMLFLRSFQPVSRPVRSD